MRVAIATESFFPRVNGVSNSVAQVVKHLSGQGIETEIIAPGPYPGSEFHGSRVHRVRSVTLPGVHDFDISIARTSHLVKILEKFQPTVLHLASPFVLGNRALQAARLLNIPTVAVFQTDVAGYARHYGLASMAFLADGIVRRIHANSSLNLVPSTSAQQYLRGLGITDSTIWGRGVDHTTFSPTHRSPSVRAGWQVGDKVVIGYCGRLAPEKGIGMLKHLQGDARIQLVVIGDGPERTNLQHLLPAAKFTGRLTGSELGSAMASLDVLIAPGELETFCQVIQEAMACGLPVVAPAVGGPLDLIRDGENGFLYQPGNYLSMVQVARRLTDDPGLRHLIGQRAAAGVQARTWAALGDELIGHYYFVSQGAQLPVAA